MGSYDKTAGGSAGPKRKGALTEELFERARRAGSYDEAVELCLDDGVPQAEAEVYCGYRWVVEQAVAKGVISQTDADRIAWMGLSRQDVTFGAVDEAGRHDVTVNLPRVGGGAIRFTNLKLPLRKQR